MSKASSVSNVSALIAMVLSGLIGAVLAKALDNPAMIPAVGTGVVLVVVALGLLPKNGLLRHQHLGRERWVKVLALILICAYPLILFFSLNSGEYLYLTLVPALSVHAAASLLAWTSFRRRLNPMQVMTGVGTIGLGFALFASALPVAISTVSILLATGVAAACVVVFGAVMLMTQDIDEGHPLDPLLYASGGFAGCLIGLVGLSTGKSTGILIMGLGVSCLGFAVGSWAKSRKSDGVAMLLVGATFGMAAYLILIGQESIFPTYPTQAILAISWLVLALSCTTHGLCSLAGKNVTRYTLAPAGASVVVFGVPLFQTRLHAVGIAVTAFGIAGMLLSFTLIADPKLAKSVVGWLRKDGSGGPKGPKT